MKCIICGLYIKSQNYFEVISFEKTINKTKKIQLAFCNNHNCKHIFQINFNQKHLNSHYNFPRLLINLKKNKTHINYLDNRVKFIKDNSNFTNINSVLEIGPGDGLFLRRFKKKNYFFLK